MERIPSWVSAVVALRGNSQFYECTLAPLLTWLLALSSNKLRIGNQAESLSALRLSACKTMQLW